MAILTLTSADAGKTIPVSGSVDWSVFGTEAADTIEVAAGSSATVDGGAGTDVVKLLGGSADYTVKLFGSSVVFTHTSTGKTVTVPVTSAGDSVSFGNGTAVTLKSTGSVVTLGAQTISTTDAAVTGATGTATGATTGTTAGQSFSLTNSATGDAPALTTGSDTITGAAGTIQTVDRLLDASSTDNDVFNATVTGYTNNAIEPSIFNIENVNVNGQFTATGFDLTNANGIKTLTLTAGIAGSTARVDDAAATKAATITAGTNIADLTVNTLAAGTTNLVVNAGAAPTVAITGGAGNDVVTLNAAAVSAITINDTGATTADAITLNLAGGANTLTNTTASAFETLTINSNTAANTVTLQNANALAAAVAAGNKVVLGGTQALTIVGDGDAIGGTTRLNGVVFEKSAGAGTETFQNTIASTATFFNRAVIDVLDLRTVIANTAITVNEATTLKLSFDQTSGGAATYDVDNNTATAITAGTGTLKLDLAASQTVNAVTLGAGVGTAQVTANTANVTLAAYDTATTATTVDTTSISGSKNVTITSWVNGANDVISAADLTGTLTVTGFGLAGNAGVVVGGSGSDSITVAGNAAVVIRGGAGSDTLNGLNTNTAKVSAFGDAGDDNITGGTIGDLLDGGEGNDLITANGGADTITGGAGLDTIVGGTGSDIITGGAGDDVFQYVAGDTGTTVATNFDTITDWSAGDRVDMTAGAITVAANNVAAVAATSAAVSATGIASFAAADNTLALKLAALAAAGTNLGARAAATFVDGTDSYLFISDGVAGIAAGNDVFIKLTGVQVASGITINASGDISAIA